MPIYAFDCTECGPFEVMRPMADSALPASCPRCANEARRVFSPPGLALLDRPVRTALDREEKSAHEPDVVTRKSGRALHAHGHHHHGHHAAQPWVLSH